MIRKIKYISILILSLSQVLVFAQQSPVDSLTKLIVKASNDSNKVKAINDLAWEYLYANDYQKALQTSEEGVELATKINFQKGIAISLNDIGIIYSKLGNYPKALEYFLKSLKIKEALNDKAAIAATYNNIGLVHSRQNEFDQALEYFFKALPLIKTTNNKVAEANTINNIGNAYRDKNDLDNALKYHLQGLKIKEELGNKRSMAASLSNIGNLYSQLNDHKKALEYFEKSLSLIEETGDKMGISSCFIDIGGVYSAQGEYKKALQHCLKGLEIAKEMQLLESERQANQNLSFIYDKLGQHDKALYHYRSFIALRDSLINEENTKKLITQELNFSFDKKQQEQQLEQAKKDAVADEEIKRQRMQRNSFIIGFILVLLLAVFIFRGYKQKQKANKIISAQKAEVEREKLIIEDQKHIIAEKNKEIIDSISYAKRLQEAILPPKEFIDKLFPENFVLYKPKDIVAGDFYWSEQKGDLSFIAAADSTGHGVPGAMVSVVCSNALNRSLKEFNITETGKLLDKTRELVLETFEKSTTEVKDGMDISLLCLDRKNRKLWWSGANNPLWYIEEGELKEITANKQPIGKTDNEKPFTTHSIEYKEGSIFYLFTDGYADQFGGEKGKKFKYKQLSDLLLANWNLSLVQQSNLLNEKFIIWQRDLEQVDDVCIIGLKL